MGIHPEFRKTGEAINKTVAEKAFRIDKQREVDQKRLAVTPIQD
ncbi:MAG: hypothetical protein ACTSP9_11630 [Promethearchaeota archaeon]